MPVAFDIGDCIRAPGKLVLAGEYSVIDGGPAIVLAINRGVQCTIKNGQGLHTPNGDTRFVDVLHKASLTKHFEFQNWNEVELGDGFKPGFGGSAAACVVACAIAGHPLNQAQELHHSIQGSGSGIDVISSIHGGMLRFENQEITVLPPIKPVVIWTGQSAKTGPRVEQYLQYQYRSDFVKNSTELVNAFIEDPIESSTALYQLLVEMSQETGIAYRSPVIEEIHKLAKQYGGSAKPSGAGGGDCMVAFFPDIQCELEFSKKIAEHPIAQIIPIEISLGVHCVNPIGAIQKL